MILSGPAIRGAVERGEISITPFDPERLNPASYDLELGDEVAVYTAEERDLRDGVNVGALTSLVGVPHELDSKVRQPITIAKMDPTGFTIYPGHLYLMSTKELATTRKFVPRIEGKSSIGRLGVIVHATAGFGDPGFDGQYTLEVVSLAHPVVLYPGMRIAQICFFLMQGEAPSYQERGNYTRADALGPVRSASWRQFR